MAVIATFGARSARYHNEHTLRPHRLKLTTLARDQYRPIGLQQLRARARRRILILVHSWPPKNVCTRLPQRHAPLARTLEALVLTRRKL